ncbi:MAG: nucleotidyltransferase domain-containing protein [bacterium]
MDKEKIKRGIERVAKRHREIVAAYLYGSHARGLATEKSDIDVAILLDEGYSMGALYPARIIGEIEKELRLEVDVRILNESSPRFIHQVLKYGEVVYSRAERKRIAFEVAAMRMYLDMKPLHAEYNRIRRALLAR